jgi:hypothetical protein
MQKLSEYLSRRGDKRVLAVLSAYLITLRFIEPLFKEPVDNINELVNLAMKRIKLILREPKLLDILQLENGRLEERLPSLISLVDESFMNTKSEFFKKIYNYVAPSAGINPHLFFDKCGIVLIDLEKNTSSYYLKKSQSELPAAETHSMIIFDPREIAALGYEPDKEKLVSQLSSVDIRQEISEEKIKIIDHTSNSVKNTLNGILIIGIMVTLSLALHESLQEDPSLGKIGIFLSATLSLLGLLLISGSNYNPISCNFRLFSPSKNRKIESVMDTNYDNDILGQHRAP